jgi:hypothetical protein
MGTSGIFGLSSQLSNSLTQMQEKQQEDLAVNTDVAATLVSMAQTDSVSISSEAYAKSQNMLETNFVDGNTADTTYVDAQLAAFSVRSSLQNSMNDSLKSSLESIVAEASFWYSDPRMRNAKQLKDSIESNQKLFSELRDNIEEQAAAATAPKDANGNPIEEPAAASSTENTATDTAQAPDASIDSGAAAQAAGAPSQNAAPATASTATTQAADAVSSISLEV